jgi:hydroxymethylbilane synthase
MHTIKIAARDSLLSRVQVQEVFVELQRFFPDLHFETFFMKTTGDLNLQTSLLGLEKTDFFTQELDSAVLTHKCDVAIHSAKDLPQPLPIGLKIYAITQGVDPSDVLVLREGETLSTLPRQAKIGTSSLRRIETVKALLKECKPIDIRGAVEQRLALLLNGEVDAVVVAEAALIRLKLTHLNRYILQGEVSAMQGRLAVVGRENNPLLDHMFQSIHSR